MLINSRLIGNCGIFTKLYKADHLIIYNYTNITNIMLSKRAKEKKLA